MAHAHAHGRGGRRPRHPRSAAELNRKAESGVREIIRELVHTALVSLAEPYVIHSDTRSFDPVHVPENPYYVLGDNLLVCNDSRHRGFVSDEFVIGRVWLSY